jgi:hypothetical protein
VDVPLPSGTPPAAVQRALGELAYLRAHLKVSGDDTFIRLVVRAETVVEAREYGTARVRALLGDGASGSPTR